MNSMSEVLNKFVGVLENRNKKFSNLDDDFLMPLPESIKEEIKTFFYEVAPSFVYLKDKSLLNESLASANKISEKQMYDLYQISQKILPLKYNNQDEMYNKLCTAYLERNDLLFIPNLEKTQRTLSTLNSLLRVSHHLPQSPQDKESLEKSISEVSLSANQSLAQVREYKERNEGLSPRLEHSANQLDNCLNKLNEQLAQYEQTKRIFDKNSKDPFNFNTRPLNDTSSIQEIENGKMNSKQVHSMLNLNKTMIELRNQYILRVDDHTTKHTI